MRERVFAAAAGGAAVIMACGLTTACTASQAASSQATVTHFTAHYSADGVDRWTCSGTHTTLTGGRAKETETCLITGVTIGDAKTVGTHTGHPKVKMLRTWPASPWHSDYNHHATATSFTITVRAAGHRDSSGYEAYQANITAYYSS